MYKLSKKTNKKIFFKFVKEENVVSLKDGNKNNSVLNEIKEALIL